MKEKIPFFLIGLMLGLLIGLGFFILKLDDYFQELSIYKNIGKNFITNVVEKKTETDAEKNNKKGVVFPSYKQAQTITLKNIKQDSSRFFFAQKTAADSISDKDSLGSSPLENNTDENVVVKKDELLFTKICAVIDLNDNKSEVTNKKDSLLQVVSEIKNDIPSTLNIEYWKSPLNYKGYKMTKNKIILYGMSPDDELKLYRFNRTTYLKSPSGTYSLEYSNDFRQLEKVVDESVLAVVK